MKLPEEPIVAFTGHRPDKLRAHNVFWKGCIGSQLTVKLRELRPRLAISGMAAGVDQHAAQACVDAGVPFVAAVPFEGQDAVWPQRVRETYRELLSKAVGVTYVSPPPYAAWKMMVRNRWMVDRCELLLAVWDGSDGGTANTVRYAQSVGRTTLKLDPKTLRWTDG